MGGALFAVSLFLQSVMVSISAAVGPLFGGFMTTFLSLRWGFAVELIFVIFILVMQHKIPDFEPTESRSDLDITGAIISLIGLVLFVWGILMLTKDTSTSIMVIVAGLIILAAFAWFESKRKSNGKVPLLDMGLFKDRNLRVGAIIRLIGCLAMGGALFAVSLFLQSVMQLNALNTGLTTLPMTIGLLIFAIAAPSLSTKVGHKKLIALGSLIAIAGCLILSYQFRLFRRKSRDAFRSRSSSGRGRLQSMAGIFSIWTTVFFSGVSQNRSRVSWRDATR